MPRKPAEQINKLTNKMLYQLTEYTREHYAARGLPDTAFAEEATQALGFPVSQHNVAGAREVLDIPSTREVLRASKANGGDPSPTRLRKLEVDFADLYNEHHKALDRLSALEAQFAAWCGRKV